MRQRLGGINGLILLRNGATGHFQRIKASITGRSALRVVIQKGTCAQGKAGKLGLLNGCSQVCSCIILIVCVSHHSASKTARMSAFFMELLTPSTPFSSA